MTNFDQLLPLTFETIDRHLERLEGEGDSDSQANYLYFLRDKVNELIKKENAARKATK